MATTMIPNTTVSILAASSDTDDYGDEIDNSTAAVTGLPAHWTVQGQRVLDPVSGRWTTISGYQVHLRPGTQIADHDRIRNERTGETGHVVEVISQPYGLLASDVIVRLSRVAT